MSIWGRLIGGAAGFALGGPIGAILGVMAGGAFDRRSKSKSSFNFNRIDSVGNNYFVVGFTSYGCQANTCSIRKKNLC